MENELMKREEEPLSANDIKEQVDLIQDVMKKVMRDKEHYGVIPGCGDKPALLKPGAEKLNLTFRMAPDPETEIIDLGEGHREYRVKCVLRAIRTERTLGAGVGSASTMETKWRFRSGPSEFTGKPVPKDYWDLRKSDPEKALALIGGKGYQTAKNPDTTQWEIVIKGERIEHDNPADYYNTCWKMAKKRALVDAVLTVTAASDIFTQDVEEMVENEVTPPKKDKPPVDMPREKGKEGEASQNPTVEVTIDKITLTEGKKDGKDWTKYTIHAGEKKYSTFSKTVAETAKRSIEFKITANIEFKDTKFGPEIVSLTLNEAPEPGSEE